MNIKSNILYKNDKKTLENRGVKYNKNDRYTVEKIFFSQCKFGAKQGGTL